MKFKKFIGMLMAVACTGMLMGSLSIPVSANTDATYDDCDVNHDGKVDSVDALIITKHLIGAGYVDSDQQRWLDTNKNQIIDTADRDYVLAKISGYTYKATFLSREKKKPEVAFNQYSPFITDGANESTDTEWYTKYIYDSKSGNSNLTTILDKNKYKLEVQSAIFPTSNVSTYGQVGPENSSDTATGLPENSGIVQVRNDGTTGFIVGNHQIATAAHCVYGKEKNGTEFIKPINLKTFNSDGELTGETLTPVEVHIPQSYRDSRHKTTDIEHDYALITVAEDLSVIDEETKMPKYVQFSVSTSFNVSDIMFDHVPIYVTGVNDKDILYTAEGRIYNSADNSLVLKYDTDTNSGQSGSPVYTITKQTIAGKESYVYTALAVHSGFDNPNYNRGPRMVKYLTAFYTGNYHIGY